MIAFRLSSATYTAAVSAAQRVCTATVSAAQRVCTATVLAQRVCTAAFQAANRRGACSASHHAGAACLYRRLEGGELWACAQARLQLTAMLRSAADPGGASFAPGPTPADESLGCRNVARQ